MSGPSEQALIAPMESSIVRPRVERKTMSQFIEDHQIGMKCIPVDNNPFWAEGSEYYHHYRCDFTFPDCSEPLEIYFSSGWGNMREMPGPVVILTCLVDDMRVYLKDSFDLWRSKFEATRDHGLSERQWAEMRHRHRFLKRVLNSDDLDEFLYHLKVVRSQPIVGIYGR